MSQTTTTGFDLSYTEEQIAVRDVARSFADSEIRPVVMHFDERMEFPTEIFKKLGDLGFLGIMVPTELGGAGLGATEASLVIEEVGRIDPSMGLSVAAHNGLCVAHINLFGSDAQKKKYLPDLAAGTKLGAWGLTEPGSGSDSAGLLTTATKVDGGYTLNGSKIFMTHGSVGETAVVLAMTDKSKGTKGISAFILERSMKGYMPMKKENKLGMRCSDTSFVIFENVFVPAENLIGEEGQGFVQAMKVLDGGRISIAALSLGCAEGAFDAALKYSQERKQFGKRLCDFQAIQFKLAQMGMNIETSRMLTYRAAHLRDSGQPYAFAASQAKLFASETAVRCSEEGVQIHGGYGYIKEFPAEKYYRDSKLLTIGEGTSEVQRMVIARAILR